MPHEELSYKKLNEKLLGTKEDITYKVGVHEYWAYQGRGGNLGSEFFYFITDLSAYGDKVTPTEEGKEFKKGKLKFHVFLPEHDRDQFAKGFDIVKDILIDNHVQGFKVVHENQRMSVGSGGMQRGKDITFYGDYNPEKTLADWQMIIQKITENLVAANIPPGYETVKDLSYDRHALPIAGCNYVSYRYEDESYMKAIDKGTKLDLCKAILINVANQPPPTPWVSGQQNVNNVKLDLY